MWDAMTHTKLPYDALSGITEHYELRQNFPEVISILYTPYIDELQLRAHTFSTMSFMLWEWSSTKETGSVVPHRLSTSRANWMAARESPPSWLKLELPSPSSSVSMPSVSAAACRCQLASVLFTEQR